MGNHSDLGDSRDLAETSTNLDRPHIPFICTP
jgi:hypothetical protein